jgi:hypothetical protein
LEHHERLVAGQDRYSATVRDELLAMSAATIDRYLKPVRDKAPDSSKAATKADTLLRNSVAIRKAGDKVEHKPGFLKSTR